jgi:hypothetical protein
VAPESPLESGSDVAWNAAPVFRARRRAGKGAFVSPFESISSHARFAGGDLDTFLSHRRYYHEVLFNDGAGNFTVSGQSLGTSNSIGTAAADFDDDGDQAATSDIGK